MSEQENNPRLSRLRHLYTRGDLEAILQFSGAANFLDCLFWIDSLPSPWIDSLRTSCDYNGVHADHFIAK
jgi:hypothetical protein